MQELEAYIVRMGGEAQLSIRTLSNMVTRRHPELKDNYNLTRTLYNLMEELPWAKHWGVGYRTTTATSVVRRIYSLKKGPSRTKARSCPEVLA